MRWTSTEDQQLNMLYSSSSLTLDKIAEILDRSVPSISERLGKLGTRRRFPHDLKSPKGMTCALARIHAHICGDGYMYKYKEKDNYGYWAKYRKNKIRTRYVIGYCNNTLALIKEFQNDMHESFGVRGKLARKNINYYVRINSKRIWKFMDRLEAGSSYSWQIPKEITDASSEVKRSWIRAFFDDEAYFNDGGRIRVKCVNKRGLRQLNTLLSNFVPCHLLPKRGFYWGKTVCISINKNNADKFFQNIGSIRYQPKN